MFDSVKVASATPRLDFWLDFVQPKINKVYKIKVGGKTW